MISEAIRHMKGGGKSLGIGHSTKASSLYKNPQLYPQVPGCFPIAWVVWKMTMVFILSQKVIIKSAESSVERDNRNNCEVFTH